MGQVQSSRADTEIINTGITAMVNANTNDEVLGAVHQYAGQLNSRTDILPEWVTDSICLVTITFMVAVIIYLKISINQFRKELDEVTRRSSKTHDRTLLLRGTKPPAHVDRGSSTDDHV